MREYSKRNLKPRGEKCEASHVPFLNGRGHRQLR